MTSPTTDVRREITVPGSPEHVFDLFTKHMLKWWPTDHHLATSPVVAMTVEPHVGGRIYDRSEDGSESSWGQVTQWDPPARLEFAWMITGTWQLETDVQKASRVAVSFTADGDRTRVVVVHNEFWRLPEGGEGMAGTVATPEGWALGLQRFADFIG
jgi:uncharacterized protein YndB with AHSA1/START domain